jgi:hypothetical protein
LIENITNRIPIHQSDTAIVVRPVIRRRHGERIVLGVAVSRDSLIDGGDASGQSNGLGGRPPEYMSVIKTNLLSIFIS